MRVVAVGAGGHATANIWPALRAAGHELVAVCTRQQSSASAAAERFGVATAHDSVSVAIDRHEPDAIVAVVPPAAYREVLEVAIDRRVATFCDKPAAISADEAQTLARTAEEKGVPIVVGYQKRFAPAYLRAAEIAASDDFGAVTGASFRWIMGTVAPNGSGPTRSEWLVENPVHHFDLLRWLVGSPRDLHAEARTRDGDHTVALSAVTDSGVVVSLLATTTGSWMQHNERVELLGQGHAVVVDGLDTCIHRPPERPELVWRPNPTVPIPENSSSAVMGFAGEIAHFGAVVAGHEPNRSSLGEAAETLALTERIIRHVEEHTT